MKGTLLVTTAALTLMIAAGANAQTASDTKADQPAASQNHSERGSAIKDKTRRDARNSDREKAGTADAKSAGTKAASDTKSDAGKPATAQDSTSPSRSNAAQSTPTDKAGDKASTAASDKSNDKTNAAKQDDKSSISSRSAQSTESTSTKSNTVGQTDTKQPAAAQRSTTDRNQATTDSKTNDTNRAAATNTKTESATRISASLQTEQKTRLNQAITRLDAKPVTQVNFSISVGTAVPRTIDLHPVPTTIVEIVPQYRGYDYFVVRDQVIIVQPETHKIVDVIERGGSSRASVSTTHERRVKLSEKQRSYIRQHATARRTTTTTTTTGSAPRHQTIVVGEEVPASVVIEAFPEDVYREVPTVREYRYVRSGSDVYLVDPGSRRVIEELE